MNAYLLSIQRKNVTTDFITRHVKIEPEFQVKN